MTNPRFASQTRGNYDIVVALFCAMLLISNIAATKLIAVGPDSGFFPLILDGGAFLFPLTYVLGDVLAEVYGLSKARRAIGIGFAVSVIAAMVFALVDAVPPAPDWPNQDAWHAVLGFVPRIVLASVAGFVIGQLLNAVVLVRIKSKTRENRLWLRLLGSSVVGELADTLTFCLIAWVGVISGATMINYILVGYCYKLIVETAFMPLTYRVIGFIKAREPEY